MENTTKDPVFVSPQNSPSNRNNFPTTSMVEVFSDSHLSSSRSPFSTIFYPEDSASPSPLSLSQSELSSSDSEPETCDFDLNPTFPIFGSLGCDYIDDDDQVSFITNLFDCSPENGLNSDPSVVLELGAVDCDVDLELGLGLGLGLGVALPTEERHHIEGLRVVSVDPESDSEDEVLGTCDDGGGFDGVSDFDRPPFCWDYLGFNNRRNDNEDLGLGRVNDTNQSQNGEIELSSIVADDGDDDEDGNDDGAFFFGGCHSGFDDDFGDDLEIPSDLDTDDGRGEIREESILFDIYEEEEEQEVMIQSDTDEETDFSVEEAIRDLEWEILIAVNNFNREVYDMGLNVDMYEAILSEVEDRVNDCKGNPPASHLVIENLPSVRLTQESLKENCIVCAICKEEVSGEEMMRQLPCLHYYHGDCIVPWLKIRNTCPICRHELPTDDHEYEYRKLDREEQSVVGDLSLNTQVENGFHLFL